VSLFLLGMWGCRTELPLEAEVTPEGLTGSAGTGIDRRVSAQLNRIDVNIFSLWGTGRERCRQALMSQLRGEK
jgi:hypothetical protein